MRGRIAGLRKAGLAALALGLLAACGQAVTISMPALPRGPAASAPPGYERLFSPAPHAFRTAEAPDPVRRGARSERYELRDGECGGSDCGQGRARAQVVEDRDATQARLDRDIWFGWSFLNATIPPVTRERWLGTVVGEWKLLGEQPALFRLIQVAPEEMRFDACDPAVCTRAGSSSDDVVLELDEIAQALGWGDRQNDGRVCRLFSMEAARAQWMDIVVNTNFGTDGYGTLRVWVNGELRCNYLGPLVSPARAGTAVLGPTHRRGIFNSYTRRWDESQGGAPKPTLVAFYDEFLVGRARADVDTRLREAQGLRPVN